ncbi:eukaryotic translation initiation factor 4 gamma [Penaeus vannamei]|uniref:Eukaryotic translation initiation factor 4 gamma n=1 Tax=Penaeus vannamei TaxID=6689 RepID=A0A3R7QVA4_PENVA|nr:eukaryotic translation initiation factor 4 gamma [Penaeus vannamei]
MANSNNHSRNPHTGRGDYRYDSGYLRSLRFNPMCLQRPANLPDEERVEPTPTQTWRGGRGREGTSREEGCDRISIIPKEAKLNTTQNAWKPAVRKAMDEAAAAARLGPSRTNWRSTALKQTNGDDEAAKTAEVVKRVRAILNKLTPEKFEKLSGQVKELEIDNTERLSAVIDLIFEKAIDEQSFSSTYAQLCQVLSQMSVQGASNGGSSEVKFFNLIIKKCRMEFQKNDMGEFLVKMESDLSKCTDPARKQELKLQLELQETKLRRRAVGNLRFIGELYKVNLMVGSLLSSQCRDRRTRQQLENYFVDMGKIVRERRCTNRMRFLIMDVIDLKKNRWVPRRAENKPKTMAEVHEEIEKEEKKTTGYFCRSDRYRH